jgi:DNA-binding transcriptional LysR family regulator
MHSGAQVEALTRGALDIAVVREPVVASGIASGIASRELVREPFVLLLPPRHALRRHRTPSLSRCAADPFILFRRAVSPTLHDQIHAICRESGFVPHVVHEASEWHTIMALVAAGAGVSIAPASVAVLRIRGATVRPLRSTTGRAVLYLCYEPRAASTEARQLAAFVQRAMRRTRTRTEA